MDGGKKEVRKEIHNRGTERWMEEVCINGEKE